MSKVESMEMLFRPPHGRGTRRPSRYCLNTAQISMRKAENLEMLSKLLVIEATRKLPGHCWRTAPTLALMGTAAMPFLLLQPEGTSFWLKCCPIMASNSCGVEFDRLVCRHPHIFRSGILGTRVGL